MHTTIWIQKTDDFIENLIKKIKKKKKYRIYYIGLEIHFEKKTDTTVINIITFMRNSKQFTNIFRLHVVFINQSVNLLEYRIFYIISRRF